MQAVPDEHALPQPPQFDASLDVSTHDFPHSVSPTAHAAWHDPLEHVRPAVQTWPHEPQFSPSLPVLVQLPLQTDCPAEQVGGGGGPQVPFWQVLPLGHWELWVHVCATT